MENVEGLSRSRLSTSFAIPRTHLGASKQFHLLQWIEINLALVLPQNCFPAFCFARQVERTTNSLALELLFIKNSMNVPKILSFRVLFLLACLTVDLWRCQSCYNFFLHFSPRSDVAASPPHGINADCKIGVYAYHWKHKRCTIKMWHEYLRSKKRWRGERSEAVAGLGEQLFVIVLAGGGCDAVSLDGLRASIKHLAVETIFLLVIFTSLF